MDAAALIRVSRGRAGLSQGALAARAGTSQPAVPRYEPGASPPRRLDVRTPRMVKLRANRGHIRKAAHRHGATNVRVFGSVARGEDRLDSDIDLLVDMDVRTHGLFPLAALGDELSELLGERVDVVPMDALAPHVAAHAVAEAVPL